MGSTVLPGNQEIKMFANQYEEHLAHSAPCSSRWDGFDRGTDWADEVVTTIVIGRMTSESGHRVQLEITEFDDGDTEAKVLVNGKVVFCELEDNASKARARAITVGRWWMAGCPA